jgi:hypothetical protein
VIPTRFTQADAERAYDEWGANCGPGAIAAITGKTLDEVRPFLGDFEAKHYTNPTLMFDSLKRLGIDWRKVTTSVGLWPNHGLVRIQWEGPWTAPGVPMRVRYRHTHWVGAETSSNGPKHAETRIFDINCMCVGGWVPLKEWSESVVPWILRELVPKADGRWHMTHVIEVAR